MSTYVLPLIINSRRAYFLDLRQETESGSETFIIEIPNHKFPFRLLDFRGNDELRTLVIGGKDHSLAGLIYDCEFNEAANKADINIRLAKENGHPLDTIKILEGKPLSLETKNLNSSFMVDGRWDSKNDKEVRLQALTVTITFTDERNHMYKGSIRICLAAPETIVQCGLDFGSEASQLEEYRYVSTGYSINGDQNAIELFTAVANSKGITEDGNYLQEEKGKPFLKSMFFLKKKLARYDRFFTKEDELSIITSQKTFQEDTSFKATYEQLPNLKLAHKYPELFGHIKMEVAGATGGITRHGFKKLRDVAYGSILREIFLAYFRQRRIEAIENDETPPHYYRITLLVPNIYQVKDIQTAKDTILAIVNDFNDSFVSADGTQAEGHIEGVEVAALSESDASFLGHFTRGVNAPAPSSFYLVVDCGKGTTDFSIVRTGEDNAYDVRPLYRNGFAGAGNLVTFAFFDALVHRFLADAEDPVQAQAFFESYDFTSDNQNGMDLQLLVEKLKREYTSNKAAAANAAWAIKDRNSLNVGSVLKNGAGSEPRDVLSVATKAGAIDDSSGYIAQAVDKIADTVAENLKQVLDRIDNNLSAGGILLTGRAFLFKPLRDAMEKKLAILPRLKGVSVTFAREPKEVCMKGLFMSHIITHSESNGTPVWVEVAPAATPVSANAKTATADGKKSGLLGRFNSVIDYLFAEKVDVTEQSTVRDNNTSKDYSRHKLYIGSTLYRAADNSMYSRADTQKSGFVFTNEGYFLRAFNTNNELSLISSLREDSDLMRDHTHALVAPSAFPLVIDRDCLYSLKEEYKAQPSSPKSDLNIIDYI